MASNNKKPRTQKTYNRKLDKLMMWYDERTKAREALKKTDPKKLLKLKPLKPLDFYVDRLKSVAS